MYKLLLSTVFIISASLLSTFLNVGLINALDLEGAKEQPCFKITKTADVDPKWEESSTQDSWYYPLMSRLDLYYSSIEVSGKDAHDLQENEVYYDSCMRFGMLNDTIEMTGFDGKRILMEVTPENTTSPDVKGCRFTFESGKGGVSYPTLTDNATFIFAAACMDDNQMTWGVSSTEKTLPEKTVKLIYEHAESLGFKKEFFTGVRYDYCKF